MEGELATLMEVFHRVKEAGGSAKLTLLTRRGKVNAKLDLGEGLPPAPPSLPTSTAADSTSPLPTSPAALRPSGQRKRSKAARRKAKARAAAHQASLASGPGASSSPSDQPTAPASGAPRRRPLHLLPSPPDGRRRVMSLGRREVPSTSFLNLDGAPPPISLPWSAHPCGLGECEEFEHCETCFRCQDLCPDHLGCTCRDDVICAICTPDVLEALTKKFKQSMNQSDRILYALSSVVFFNARYAV